MSYTRRYFVDPPLPPVVHPPHPWALRDLTRHPLTPAQLRLRERADRERDRADLVDACRSLAH